MGTIELIEAYLVKHIDKLDLIIDDVLFLLPDSYFYPPEIHSGELLAIRKELYALIQKKNFAAYKNDNNLEHQYKKMVDKYTTSLSDLVVRKRRQLREELLSETIEIKCACMLSLIKKYHLLSRLRAYK